MSRTVAEYSHLPKIDAAAVKMLWHCDFWDGPISGVCIYNDRKCWFQMCAEATEDSNDFYRRFLVLELLPDQLKDEEYWHNLFREKVGEHTDYDQGSHRKIGKLKPRELWSEFYEPYQRRVQNDYTLNPTVGWFER